MHSKTAPFQNAVLSPISSTGHPLAPPQVMPNFMPQGATAQLPPFGGILNGPRPSRHEHFAILWLQQLKAHCIRICGAANNHPGLFPSLLGPWAISQRHTSGHLLGMQQHTMQVMAQEGLHLQPHMTCTRTTSDSSPARKQC